MFYHIFDYLEQFDFPGAGMFQYITFRSACSGDFVIVDCHGGGKAYYPYFAEATGRGGERSGTWGWKGRCRRREHRRWAG